MVKREDGGSTTTTTITTTKLLALALLVFMMPIPASLVPGGFAGCYTSSLTSLTSTPANVDMNNRTCVERCRYLNQTTAVVSPSASVGGNDLACYCAGTVTTSTCTGGGGNLAFLVNQIPATNSCWILYYDYAVFATDTYTVASTVVGNNATYNVICDLGFTSQSQGSLLMTNAQKATVTKNGVDLNIQDMSPYNASSPGIDITGSGILIDVGNGGDIETHVATLKLPIAGTAGMEDPLDVTIDFMLGNFNSSAWWNPDETEATNPSGTSFSLSRSHSADPYGVLPMTDPANVIQGWLHFSASVIRITGSVTDLRLDFLGEFYNRSNQLVNGEDTTVGCQILASDFGPASQTFNISDASSTSDASSQCNSFCGGQPWQDKRYIAFRRIGPRQFRCQCITYGSVVGGIPDSSLCAEAFGICSEIQSYCGNLFNTNALLTNFLSSTSWLQVSGVAGNPSTTKNLCNSNRTADLAAAYLITAVGQSSNWFYTSTLNLASAFTYNAPWYYYTTPPGATVINVTDPVVTPIYRRVSNAFFGGNQYYLIDVQPDSIYMWSGGVYAHCVQTSAILCPSETVAAAAALCQQVFQTFQMAFFAVANRDIASNLDLTIPSGCEERDDLLTNNFFPYSVVKVWTRNCGSINTWVSQLAMTLSSNQQAMVPYNTSTVIALPGTTILFHCSSNWALLDSTNPARGLTCLPYSATNFATISLCYPPRCKNTIPAPVVTDPSNGTRVWNETVLGNGTFLNTIIPYTCPANYAFNQSWTNELDNTCEWNAQYNTAVWQYWDAPGPNMTNSTADFLPTCVPYCFASLNVSVQSYITYSLPQNTVNQTANITCNPYYEYTDTLAVNANNSATTSDDYLMSTRSKICEEPVAGEGGAWVNVEAQPNVCYIINCTKNQPPPNGTDMAWSYSGAQPIVLPYQSVISYTCLTYGKEFYNAATNQYFATWYVTCLGNKSWEYTTQIYPCQYYYCLNPPAVPLGYKLVSDYVASSPPNNQGGFVTYTCNAGGYNKFVGNFSMNSFQIPCLPNNVMNAPSTWPQCASNVNCGFPPSTINITSNETNLLKTFSYDYNVTYSCVDLRMDIKISSLPATTAAPSIESTCQWDSTSWSYTSSNLSCVLTSCTNFPVPSTSSNMVQATSLNLTRVPLGTVVTYQCITNYYFNNQIIPTNRSLTVTCNMNTGYFNSPTTWPTCIPSTPCPHGPLNSTNSAVEQSWTTGDTTAYLTVSNYSCVDYRYFVIAPNNSGPVEAVFSTCQWDQKWSLDPYVSNLTCQLYRCLPPPDESVNNLANNWNGNDVLLGSSLTYTCVTSPYPTYFASNRSVTSIVITCVAATGVYNAPAQWPECVSDVSCGTPVTAPSPVGTLTYLNYAFVGQDDYNTQIEYSCGPGRSFVDGSVNIISTCNWNANWSVTILPACKVVNCSVVPTIPSSAYMIDPQPSVMTAVNQSRTFICKSGSKFVNNITLDTYQLMCLPSGQYQTPVWPQCTSTVQCTGSLPTTPSGGKLLINGVTYNGLGAINNIYQTQLVYQCGPSQQFMTSIPGTTYQNFTMVCNWNQSWTPDPSTINNCTWTQCPTALTPPSASQLQIYQWNGQPISFGGIVLYECESGTFFEADMNQVNFALLCNPDGTFNISTDASGNQIWPNCVSSDSVYCPDPPAPLSPNGGRTWYPTTASKRRRKRASSLPNYELDYGSTFGYTCGPGFIFFGIGSVPPVGTPEYAAFIARPNYSIPKQYNMQNITCSWNQTWVPTPTFDPCVALGCLSPPAAPNTSFLASNWNGVIVPFGGSVSYSCQPLNKLNLLGKVVSSTPRYFSSDQTKTSISAVCETTGNYNTPTSYWPQCVIANTCNAPPAPGTGMTMQMLGVNSTGSTTIYTCGPYAEFLFPNGTKVASLIRTCAWDGNWYPQKLNATCQPTYCLDMPFPNASTLLSMVANQQSAVNVTAIEVLHQNSWVNSTGQSSSSAEDPPTLSIPSDFCTNPNRQFMLYAQIPASNNVNTSTTIQFGTNVDGLAFAAVVYPMQNFIVRYSSRLVAIGAAGVTYEVGGPGEITSTIGPNEPFTMQISCDSSYFYLTVPGDPIYPDFPHDSTFQLNYLTSVVVTGAIQIYFMGFITEGTSPAVPVGFKVDYDCPYDYFLDNGGVYLSTVEVKCGTDGTFGDVQFSECIPLGEITSKAPSNSSSNVNGMEVTAGFVTLNVIATSKARKNRH